MLKRENGSISIMIFVTILFIITILSSAYMVNSIQRKSQLESEIQLKNLYENDVKDVNNIYNNIVFN